MDYEDDETLFILEENYNFTLNPLINGPALASIVGLELFAGFITNSLLLALTVFQWKNWKLPSTVFLTNLLLCNLLLVLLVMPFTIITGATGEWVFGRNPVEKRTVCRIIAFIFWYGITVFTFGLVILSFDRFFYVVKAVAYKNRMTIKKAVTIVIATWVAGGALNITPFFGMGKYSFIACCGVCVPRWAGEPEYIVYILIIYVTCILSIVVTSIWTCIFTRRFLGKDERRTRFVSQNTRSHLYATKNQRLLGLFGMTVLVHLLCYLPGISSSFLELFIPVPVQLYTTMYVAFLMAATLGPLVQSFFRRDIRETLSQLCGEKFKVFAVNRSFISSSSIKVNTNSTCL
ncbi:PREDICTED: ultraviolet-sensitive opsin-like [Amphimedon queenslandica]|uniref:G-protein coupled receptors family 1 profile domain-containing protein n=1 Tax=Amphimedon queenslandica TaxID=400682 RepID=A0A1X7U7H0_AMPQE|nr:PREDICTED: ultraviolet-sensitive opsin-like [Amphimedon queenslandica]XP_019855682.1 PREDICTED: ultraviolet-sensitive opsin-like [Amphimedon queenslandica]|eukprot:XP_011405825.1 PREDICTED: ultraviolet-sensitive opsin-like [Amphimedon queenslandica]